MEKVKNHKDINHKMILSWKTPQIETILKSNMNEETLLAAFENDLFDTPSDLKINPREMIYLLSTQKNLSSDFKQEVKSLTRNWIQLKSSTWNENVPPFFSEELEYILSL